MIGESPCFLKNMPAIANLSVPYIKISTSNINPNVFRFCLSNKNRYVGITKINRKPVSLERREQSNSDAAMKLVLSFKLCSEKVSKAAIPKMKNRISWRFET